MLDVRNTNLLPYYPLLHFLMKMKTSKYRKRIKYKNRKEHMSMAHGCPRYGKNEVDIGRI